jgi:hypothetical protein
VELSSRTITIVYILMIRAWVAAIYAFCDFLPMARFKRFGSISCVGKCLRRAGPVMAPRLVCRLRPTL